IGRWLCDHSRLSWRRNVPPSRGESGRNGEYMGWCSRRIEAHIVGLTPPVGLAGQLVCDDELRPIVHAECGHVKPYRGLSRLVWIQVNNHQHRVRIPLAALGETDHARLIDVMEPEITQPVQRRMGSPYQIETSKQRCDAVRLLLRLLPVPRPVGVFLRIQVFLAARPHRDVLTKLKARVDAPRW